MILIEIAFGLPFCILLFRAFVGNIPRELDEAAILDGAGPIRLFFRVILPLLRPVVVTVIVVQSVFVFNDFAEPAVLPARRPERNGPAHAVQLPEPVPDPVQPALHEHPARHDPAADRVHLLQPPDRRGHHQRLRSRADRHPHPTTTSKPNDTARRHMSNELASSHDRADRGLRRGTAAAQGVPRSTRATAPSRGRPSRSRARSLRGVRSTAAPSPTTCSARAGAATSGASATRSYDVDRAARGHERPRSRAGQRLVPRPARLVGTRGVLRRRARRLRAARGHLRRRAPRSSSPTTPGRPARVARPRQRPLRRRDASTPAAVTTPGRDRALRPRAGSVCTRSTSTPSMLTPYVGPPVTRWNETLRPTEITTSPSGKTLVDFGQNLVGWVRVRVRGTAGQQVTLRHAEVLEHGELGTRPLRTAQATDRSSSAAATTSSSPPSPSTASATRRSTGGRAS